MTALDYPKIIKHLTDQLKDYYEVLSILRISLKSGWTEELRKRAEKAILECEKWTKGEKP